MRLILTLIVIFFSVSLVAQTNYRQDSIKIRRIFDKSLQEGKSYPWLRHLSKEIGHRLSGSEGDKKAVAWGKSELEQLGLDKVWLQPVTVPHWVRGAKEEAHITTKYGTFKVPILALGGSVATPDEGITAEIVEVHSLEEVEQLGDKVKGKIVFYNRAMPPEKIETFRAYSATVGLRYSGARVAGKYGAVGAIVRSMNLSLDDHPHTGVMSYGDNSNGQKIPTAAISTNGAETLSKLLKDKEAGVQFYFKMNCKNLPDTQSFNVIGELKGTEFPNEIIVVGRPS